MSTSSKLVVWIKETDTAASLVEQAQAQASNGSFRLHCIDRLPTALARIAGGGVDAVLLDLPPSAGTEGDSLASFLSLRQEAPNLPVVLVCGATDESHALRAMQAGAADYLIRERGLPNLGRVIQYAVKFAGLKRESNGTVPSKNNRIITFIGAKGGVGATTIAMNVACALASRSKVTLAELRPAFGTLADHFDARETMTDWFHFLREGVPSALDDLGSCLWSDKKISGLNFLFGPQASEEANDELPVASVKQILAALAAKAEYVVVDLPNRLSAANRVVIENSGLVCLVVERDTVGVQSAQFMIRAIESLTGSRDRIITVLTNRASLVAPVPLLQTDAQLGHHAWGAIPPAPDLCQRAQNLHLPLITLEPDSLIADSLKSLAEHLQSLVTPQPRQDSLEKRSVYPSRAR